MIEKLITILDREYKSDSQRVESTAHREGGTVGEGEDGRFYGGVAV